MATTTPEPLPVGEEAPLRPDWRQDSLYWVVNFLLPRRTFENVLLMPHFLGSDYFKMLLWVSLYILFVPGVAILICSCLYIKNRKKVRGGMEVKVGQAAWISLTLLCASLSLELVLIAIAREELADNAVACDALSHLHEFHKVKANYRADYFHGRDLFFSADYDVYLNRDAARALFEIDSRLDRARLAWETDVGFPHCDEVLRSPRKKILLGESDRVFTDELDITFWELQYYAWFLSLWSVGALLTYCMLHLECNYFAAVFALLWCAMMSVIRMFTLFIFSDICAECQTVVMELSLAQEYDSVISDMCTNYAAWRHFYLYNFWSVVSSAIDEIKQLELTATYVEKTYLDSIISRMSDGYDTFFVARLNEFDAIYPEWCYHNLPIFYRQLYFKGICRNYACAKIQFCQICLMVLAVPINGYLTLRHKETCPSAPCPGPPGPPDKTHLACRECIKRRFKWLKKVLLTLDEEIRDCCSCKRRAQKRRLKKKLKKIEKEKPKEVKKFKKTRDTKLEQKTPCGCISCPSQLKKCACKRTNLHRTFYFRPPIEPKTKKPDPKVEPKPIVIKVEHGGKLPDSVQFLTRQGGATPLQQCFIRIKRRIEEHKKKAMKESQQAVVIKDSDDESESDDDDLV